MTFDQLALGVGILAFTTIAVFVVAVRILQRKDQASLADSVRRQLAEVEGARERKIGVAGAGR